MPQRQQSRISFINFIRFIINLTLDDSNDAFAVVYVVADAKYDNDINGETYAQKHPSQDHKYTLSAKDYGRDHLDRSRHTNSKTVFILYRDLR
jgi:hypothetical protein